MLLRRWIRALGIFRSPCHYESAGSLRSLNSACGRDSATISHKQSGSPAWPMLPPVVGGGAGEIVGCSHGWITVLKKRSNDLYLSDPLSNRKINLPPIDTLPDPDFNLDLDGYGSVSKVILSSSPDDDDCRAVMTFGPGNRLAFCLPGRSSEWTPLGVPFFDSKGRRPFHQNIAQVHEDVVYCTRRRVFTSITASHIDFDYFDLNNVKPCNTPERYDWDIQDPNSPQVVGSELLALTGKYAASNSISWLKENREVLGNECVQIPHLVYAEESDQLFVVMQFVRLMNSDSDSPLGYLPICEVKGLSGLFPGKTFGFIAMQMEEEDLKEAGRKREMRDPRGCRVVEDLNGSMIVGINHSFAVSASHEFKPNCIYFTDAKRLRMVSCAADAGVFDYTTKTISPLNHQASPFWFT